MGFGSSLLGSTPDPNSAAAPDSPPALTGQPAAPPLPASLASNPLGTPAPSAAAAPPPAAPAVHDSHIGRAFRSILGTQVDYHVDPATGQTVAMPVKATGSQIFRGILAGALAGAAAGQAEHNQNTDSGLMAGIAAGGGAGMTQARVLDAQKYQRAQEDFKNSIESRKASQELLMQQAQIAHMHAEDLHANAMMDLMASEHIQKLNDSNNVLEAQYEAKGAVPSIQLAGQDINGKQGNGYDIMAAVNKDRHALDAPQGHHRVHTQHVDTTGLKYKPGAGWVDDAGAPVDMAKRTTHTFFDIPNNTFNESVTMSNSEWNKAIGSNIFPQDDKPRTGTYGDLISLKDKATKEAREAAQTQLDKQKVLFEIAMINKQSALLNSEASKNTDRDMRADIADLTEQAKIAQKTLDSFEMSPEDKKQAQADLRDINQQLRQLRNRHTPGATTTPAGAPPPPQSTEDRMYDVATKSGLPLSTLLAQVDAATGLSSAEKANLKKRLAANQPKAAPAGRESLGLPSTETVGGVPFTAARAKAEADARSKAIAEHNAELARQAQFREK